MADFDEMYGRAMEIADLYERSNIAAGRQVWEARDYLDGMFGDMGDLSKLMMARDGLRESTDIEVKINHELDDILWSYFAICRKLGRVPGETFMKSMDELAARFDGEGK